jgi:hypothetical protein
MGIDRWKEEHRAYRPNRPQQTAEVSIEKPLPDMPDDRPALPPPRAREPKPAPQKPRRGAASPKSR